MFRPSFKNLCKPLIKYSKCVRNLTSTEVSTALRPFYFSVHPDLFGQYPTQRAINENSLQQLSSVLNSLQSSKPIKPALLQFYVKNKTTGRSKVTFRLIQIKINENDIRSAVLTILKSCELPTDYVDKIERTTYSSNFNSQNVRIRVNEVDLTKINKNHPIYAYSILQKEIEEAQEALKLNNWLKKNHIGALHLLAQNQPFKEEIERLCKNISFKLGLKDIRWECGWNDRHFRGCLLSFQALIAQHPEYMEYLKDRIIVFSNFTGVSLEGHIMLYTGEVRNNWLDLLKNIAKYDLHLQRIPVFEKSLSHVLRDIQVVRRKFMPKIVAGDYENNLNQLTTALCDFRSRNAYPKQWPDSLSYYQIVVETEAGPLMVSPTGQFIVPCGLPGTLLVNFLTTNLKDAEQKITNYNRDKHVEIKLHKQVIDELQLYGLMKDDCVTPDLMIKCCERLLEHKQQLLPCLKNLNLNITTFFSVLSDGVVNIPWNWKL